MAKTFAPLSVAEATILGVWISTKSMAGTSGKAIAPIAMRTKGALVVPPHFAAAHQAGSNLIRLLTAASRRGLLGSGRSASRSGGSSQGLEAAFQRPRLSELQPASLLVSIVTFY